MWSQGETTAPLESCSGLSCGSYSEALFVEVHLNGQESWLSGIHPNLILVAYGGPVCLDHVSANEVRVAEYY